MTKPRFTYTQTVQKPLPDRLMDLAQFVTYLEDAGKITRAPGFYDEELVKAVFAFWESRHGED